jgi:hypothetical protein
MRYKARVLLKFNTLKYAVAKECLSALTYYAKLENL